jgi:3-oxoacyl-[acyl-carrier protein] reductase
METRQVALVTGAGRGIGRGVAESLAKRGWVAIINYRTNQIAANETIEAISHSGGTGFAIQADISIEQDRKHLVEQILLDHKRIDLLVNNAGMAPRQRTDLLEMTEESYDEVMAANLKGPFFLTQLVAKKMVELVDTQTISMPKIININSISAYTISINRGEYCLSKSGMEMMTWLFADRLAKHGIYVYEIRPGIIETDMTSNVKEKYTKLIEEGLMPIQRWGQPGDVASAILALAEGALPYSTGEIINVDGGFHLRRL